MTLDEHTLHHLDDVMNHCIHCGMCLPVCPTYALTNQEQSSPRGRIRLIRSVHDGTLDLTKEFVNEMNFCLDCQACQTACPAGVQYGELVEDARQLIAEKKLEPFALRFIKTLVLEFVLASKWRTKLAARLLRSYQKSGVQEAIDQSHVLSLLSERLSEKHRMLPIIADTFFDEDSAEVITPPGKVRGRVGFLSGCVMNVAFPTIHHDAVDVLLENGFEVVIPKAQVCCGSLHGHNGSMEIAHTLARKNVQVFDDHAIDFLIVDSAGCGAFIKEYGRLLSDDPDLAAKATALSKKTKDITEFLSEVGFKKPKASFDKRVTYHEACHLVHSQKISRQPREMIASIPGLEFVELPEATWCCGSAGIYNVTRYDDSMKFLDRKMENLASTKADVVLTANPGCHLQLQYGIRKSGLNMDVMHPISVLRKAYDQDRFLTTL